MYTMPKAIQFPVLQCDKKTYKGTITIQNIEKILNLRLIEEFLFLKIKKLCL